MVLFALKIPAQDYTSLGNKLEYSDQLKKAKTYRSLNKALKSPLEVVSLKIVLYHNDTSFYQLQKHIHLFTNLKELIIENSFQENGYRLDLDWAILSKLEYVRLQGVELTEEGRSSLVALDSLKYLSMQCANLDIVPESIFQLTELKVLDLSINFIEEIPESIGNLNNLRELVLKNCCLSEIPMSIIDLESLEILTFNNVEPADLELYDRIICQNKVNTFPDSISKMKSIRDINLWQVNVPEEILSELKSIEGITVK